MEKRCQFWLPSKRRFCANAPLPQYQFCGNHKPSSEEQRIPCPIDPSHSILEQNLESHIKRCPLRKQAQDLEAKPYYKKGVNCGGDDSSSEASSFVSSETKRSQIYKMTVPEFHDLISKIKSVRSAIRSNIRDSFSLPEACGVWLKEQEDRKLPFQKKHVLQQASILGNMEAFGILEETRSDSSSDDDSWIPAVVDFGAGRGYLTQMLTDCYGIKKVFLVERRSYKLKADRSLRKKESMNLERLRIDNLNHFAVEDLNLNEIEALRGLPYLAIGKHLCGPATDLTLRCCLPEQCSQNNNTHSRDNCHLKGLALATCCHHLCQWKHYINKEYLLNLGITMEDFHAITWFSSWAVDADHSSHLSSNGDVQQGKQLQYLCGEEKEESKKNGGGVEATIKDMKVAERAALGFMCKEIIDIGRFWWLKEHHDLEDAQIVKYVSPNISPENHLLLAKYINNHQL